MNDLAVRRRLLVARSDLHRQFAAVECQQVQDRWSSARTLVAGRSWWLAGGAVVAGLVLARYARPVLRWAPVALAVWRGARR